MKQILFLFLLLSLLSLQAQNAERVNLPPTLVIRENNQLIPIVLEKLDIDVSIRGLLAETTMTMTFYNTQTRVLEGELLFPLPEGATISGYALDINGSLMDGVIVEKHEARIAFEKEVRKGVDPGLVEWTKGNNFRTRVYPIPASGRRTIRVRYIQELLLHTHQDSSDSTTPPLQNVYYLPLRFKNSIPYFSLKILLSGDRKPREIQGSIPLEFKNMEGDYFASLETRNITLSQDLFLYFTALEENFCQVESDRDGEHYFLGHLIPQLDGVLSSKKTIHKVLLFWDASLSREKTNKNKEFELLETLCQTWQNLTFDILVFRNAPEPTKTIQIQQGNTQELLQFLNQLHYDGGTHFSCFSKMPVSSYDFALLFTDGLFTQGDCQGFTFETPLYPISTDSRADHGLLKYLASQSGGEYFNLNRYQNSFVKDHIGVPSLVFLKAEYNPKEIQDVYPASRELFQGRLDITGRLLVPEATLTVHWGFGNTPLSTTELRLKKTDSVKTGLFPRFWAQKKINQLAVFPDKNKEELVRLGRRFGLVTPGTSLLVLETLEQFVEHNIEPPESHPELRNQWLKRMDELWATKNAKQKEKIEQVVALWNVRVEWWNQDFSNWQENLKKQKPELKEDHDERSLTEDHNESEESAPESSEGQRHRTGRMEGDDDDAPSGAPPSPKKSAPQEQAPTIDIVIQSWDPNTPYLIAIKEAEANGKAYAEYLNQRVKHGEAPAYYLDCANYFLSKKDKTTGVRILSSLLELDLENPALLRVIAYRLAEESEFDLTIEILREVLRLRPEEPQSYRDLGLVLASRAEALFKNNSAQSIRDFEESMALLYQVVMGYWDRFAEIETIALMELNRVIAVTERLPQRELLNIQYPPLDPRLKKLLDVDVRILLSWDADLTDVDLWIIEPSGEKAYYGYQKTLIGGHVSRDFTQGYGPEEYCLRRLVSGSYEIQANYYGSSQQSLVGPATVKATVFTNYGRPDQQMKELTLRLAQVKEIVTIGKVELKAK